MDGAKIYGLCLERLKHQITAAKQRAENNGISIDGEIILESYNTGDIEDIIDILELYDLGERTQDALLEKLDDLAYTASVLLRRELRFDYNKDGHLGIYLSLKALPEPVHPLSEQYVLTS
jgi:hypothetical protein